MRLLVSNRALTRTYVRNALTLLAIYAVFYGLTQWLEAAHGLSPREAGLLLLPMGLGAALLSQPVSARNLVRGPLVVGAISLVVGSVAVALLTAETPVTAIVGVTVLFGVALGTASSETRLLSTSRLPQSMSAPLPGSSAPSATWAASRRRLSPESSSATTSPTPVCTWSADSSSW